MKKFILALLLCIFSAYPYAPIRPHPARADSPRYACVLTDDAYFYASRDDKRGLFLLPETYYVKVLETNADFVRAEYLFDDEYTRKIVGFVKTEHLAFVDYTPVTPYCHRLFEISYTLENGGANGEDFLDRITMTCSYYGDYVVGSQTYCYVRRDGVYGYIPKPETLRIERNEEYDKWLHSQATPNPPATSSTASEQSSPLQIALLVSACFLVPALAALVLKSHTRDNEIDE